MLNPNLSNVQNMIESISGYAPGRNSPRDDYYYEECTTQPEKMNAIIEYAYEVYGLKLTTKEVFDIYGFLETNFMDESDRHTAFNEL